MKVSELEGIELDWWVYQRQDPLAVRHDFEYWWDEENSFHYSTNPKLIVRLIEEYKVSSTYVCGEWVTVFHHRQVPLHSTTTGPTLGIAVCRAVVASKYGDEVDG